MSVFLTLLLTIIFVLNTFESGTLNKLSMLLNSADENIAQADLFVNWINQDNVSIHNFFGFWFYSLRASLGGFRFDEKRQIVGFLINSLSYVLLFFAGNYIARFCLENSIKKTLHSFNLKSHTSLDGSLMTKVFAFLFMLILLTFG